MPYIQPNDRTPATKRYPENAGELNYAITKMAIDYFKRVGGRYQQVNDILGALEGAKLEFYRRLVAPYEDKKIIENGDVYPGDS